MQWSPNPKLTAPTAAVPTEPGEPWGTVFHGAGMSWQPMKYSGLIPSSLCQTRGRRSRSIKKTVYELMPCTSHIEVFLWTEHFIGNILIIYVLIECCRT